MPVEITAQIVLVHEIILPRTIPPLKPHHGRCHSIMKPYEHLVECLIIIWTAIPILITGVFKRVLEYDQIVIVWITPSATGTCNRYPGIGAPLRNNDLLRSIGIIGRVQTSIERIENYPLLDDGNRKGIHTGNCDGNMLTG